MRDVLTILDDFYEGMIYDQMCYMMNDVTRRYTIRRWSQKIE